MIPNKCHETGARLGSYEIVRLLGVGGMAAVYEARHAALGKRVAIKLLHDHLVENGVAAARFTREGRAASAVRHPNVVEMFEVGVHAGTAYLVMELLDGQDLATYLGTRGRLSAAEAVDILLPTASAVAAAHSAGVIHRDLKPRNVFLARERRTGLRPKVVDFGISKVPHDERERGLTETGSLLGTLDYMAPEQARSARNAGERSDQYALGVILYECITGRRPFAGSSTYELLHAIVTAPFAAPRAIGVDIDPGLETVILRAMSRDPSERFSSVQSFGCALLPFASETLRASWREDFEATAPRGASDEQLNAHAPIGITDADRYASLVGTTVPEDGVLQRRKRALIRPGLLLGAFATVIALAGLTSALHTKVHWDPPDTVGPLVLPHGAAALALGPGAQLGGIQIEDRNLLGSTPVASARPISAVAPMSIHGRSPGRPPPIPSSAPTDSAAEAATSFPSARLALPPPALSVERGYNGAPIVE